MACQSGLWFFFLYVMVFYLHVWGDGGVLRPSRQARTMFLRPKRANSFFFEELLQGDLERECFEERCSYEEAREYFEDTPQSISFWTIYYDGDQCDPNPCLYGGNCTDRVGGFLCSCMDSYYGLNCEIDVLQQKKTTTENVPPVTDVQCPLDGPSSCHQFCSVSYEEQSCSCTAGYRLHRDGYTCLPDAEYPCGRWLQDDGSQADQATPTCSDEHCPWQVSVVDSRGVVQCQGTVLGRLSILTSAQCLFPGKPDTVQRLRIHAGNSSSLQVVSIQAFYIHSRFQAAHDNDLVLLQLATPLVFGPSLFQICLPTKDFSENVLMRAGRAGVAGPVLGAGAPIYMTLDDCRQQLNISHPISNKMFCMRSQSGGERSLRRGRTESLSPDGAGCGRAHWRGAPVASTQRGTAFLTGLLLSQTDCQVEGRGPGLEGGRGPGQEGGRGPGQEGGRRPGQEEGQGPGLVFTKLSRYLPWVAQRLQLVERDHNRDVTPQISQYPDPSDDITTQISQSRADGTRSKMIRF